VNGVTTKYTLFGDKVALETTGPDKIHYSYDASGNLFSMNLNGTEYYYTRNVQGDITGLIDNAGNIVVSYTYDTWGKLVSTTGSLASTLGVKNPYKYRGYRYDTETGLYYLQSRYYNPDWGRFVNADGLTGLNGKLLGHNMFAYCANNPVKNFDPTGLLYMESAGFTIISAPASVQMNKSVRRVQSTSSSLVPIVLGVLIGSLEKISKPIYGYLDANNVLKLIPKTSIKQTIQPYAKFSGYAAKALLVATTFAELSGTWDPMVKMSNGRRLEKSSIQLGGTLAALGVGAMVSSPIIAKGFKAGGISIMYGVVGAFVVDYVAVSLIENIQKEIYNARGYK
jgi:RHS repeat-associated protein